MLNLDATTALVLVLASVNAVWSFPLEKRIDPPGPLYGSSGKPEYGDVGQNTSDPLSTSWRRLQTATIPNCGFAATSAALAYVNANFLTSVITPEGNFQSADSARFAIFDPESLRERPVTVSKRELPNNAGNKSPVWWPGAMEQAALKNGLSMNAVYPATALSVQTGKKASDPRTKIFLPNSRTAMDKEALWDLIQRAPQTPMVWQTLEGSPGLVSGHAYAVLGTSGSGADRQVRLYNPWGDEKSYNFDHVYPGTYGIHHLSDFSNGPAGGGGGNNENQPTVTHDDRPTPTRDPQPTTNPPDVHLHEHQGERTTTRTVTQEDGSVVVEVVVHKVVYVTAK